MSIKFQFLRREVRLDKRVWLSAIFGLPLATLFAIYCNSRLFHTAKQITTESISEQPSESNSLSPQLHNLSTISSFSNNITTESTSLQTILLNVSSISSLDHNTTSESNSLQSELPDVSSISSSTHHKASESTSLRSEFLNLSSTPALGRVTIWSPPPCYGSFVSDRAPHSKDGVPYAIIREAVIDRRPISHRQYREVHHDNSFLRIILYLSVHLSVSPTRENANISLVTTENQLIPGTISRVDYVQRVDPFLITGPYRPGRVTKRGHQVSECQVAISLAPEQPMSQPEFDKYIHELSASGSSVKLDLRFNRFDGKTITFNSSFDLACATAWEHPDVFPPLNRLRQPTCHTDVHNTTGAVVLSGSALYGKKKVDPGHYAEVAHFGARALGGPIRFDTVAMGVVVNNSVADRQLCANATCIDDMNRKNQQLLENVREVVESELDAVGLERALWSNLILVPLCRLGSDASKTEVADPCRLSHRYGQYHATFFSYAMLAPYFKWAASYDMDEFFAITPKSGSFPAGTADKILDEVNKRGRNYMYFSWLNFGVKSNSSRSVTKEILNSRGLELRHKKDDEEFDCQRLTRDPTGKSAVRCDAGIGFTIHRPVIRKSGEPLGILGQIQGEIRKTQLRTWHPRLGSSRGECVYVGRNETRVPTG